MSTTSGPISPTDVDESIPEYVIDQKAFDAMNKLIKKNMKNGVAKILTRDLLHELRSCDSILFEEIVKPYCDAGWYAKLVIDPDKSWSRDVDHWIFKKNK